MIKYNPDVENSLSLARVRLTCARTLAEALDFEQAGLLRDVALEDAEMFSGTAEMAELLLAAAAVMPERHSSRGYRRQFCEKAMDIAEDHLEYTATVTADSYIMMAGCVAAYDYDKQMDLVRKGISILESPFINAKRKLYDAYLYLAEIARLAKEPHTEKYAFEKAVAILAKADLDSGSLLKTQTESNSVTQLTAVTEATDDPVTQS